MLVSSLADDETVDIAKVKWVLVVEKEVWHLCARFAAAVTDPETGDVPLACILKPMGITCLSWDFDHSKDCFQI